MKFRKYITEKKAEMTGDEYKNHFIKILNQWDTDLTKMTKAYKSIKAKREDFFDDSRLMLGFDLKGWKNHPEMKKFFMIKNAFNIFANNFEKWVYNDILDKRKYKKETYFQEQVRTTAWTFLSDIRTYGLFEKHVSNIYDERKMYSIPMIWDYDKTIKTNVTRYQRSWRFFKEAFMDFIINMSEEIKEQTTDEQIQVSGVNIAIRNKKKDDDSYIKKFIQHLKPVLSAIKKEGLGIAIRDFYIELNFDVSSIDDIYPTFGDMVGGAYDPIKDKLYMFRLADLKITDSTLIHEIGHRFWFRNVPEKAKNAWRDKFNKQQIVVTKDYIKKFFDEFYMEYGFPLRTELKQKIESIKDPTLKIVFSYLSQHTPMFNTKDERKNERQIYLDFMIKHNEGEKLPLEWISDYGRTNEKESFAEAFKIWVGGQKRKLGPWTRAFFKEIVSTGGVNIKEEKYIDLVEKYLKEVHKVETPKNGSQHTKDQLKSFAKRIDRDNKIRMKVFNDPNSNFNKSVKAKLENQAVWTKLEGQNILQVPGTKKYAAFPATGKKNAVNFIVFDIKTREEITYLKKTEVYAWLTNAAIREKE